MKNYKVLIIENEKNTENSLEEALQEFGHLILSIKQNNPRIKAKVQNFAPDIVLLNLPIEKVRNVMTWLKELFMSGLPCIVCTDASQAELIKERKGVEACGFFVRPSSMINLYMMIQISIEKFYMQKRRKERLQHLKSDNEKLRKMVFGKEIVKNPKIFFADDLYFNTKSCETFYHNRRLQLTKKENLFIQLLVSNMGNAVSFEQVIEHIWGKENAIENNVRTLVWRLRSKIQLDVIKTISGVGYYLENSSLQEGSLKKANLSYNRLLRDSA